MKLGKLNYIYNLDKHHAANKGYYRALVYDAVERKYENLMITDGEMKKIRERARKNPEDIASASWFDRIIATIRLF
tara:strand:- start:643 stop:870 length:228 start_codon:yes stop_codon:yes gene_type:complete